ncbi:HalOD1 output domain-containing protein [Halovenus sp. HT40]|uniref:HalOD1 output domain-containing protein n=1 Tax=Halovenus sp. HT40 TaxID=3126691 RepID=UPI00300E8834
MNTLDTLTSRIVDAVAEADGVEKRLLDPPLAEVVDLDALEELIGGSTTSTLEIRFTYRGHEIIVDEDGHVRID